MYIEYFILNVQESNEETDDADEDSGDEKNDKPMQAPGATNFQTWASNLAASGAGGSFAVPENPVRRRTNSNNSYPRGHEMLSVSIPGPSSSSSGLGSMSGPSSSSSGLGSMSGPSSSSSGMGPMSEPRASYEGPIPGPCASKTSPVPGLISPSGVERFSAHPLSSHSAVGPIPATNSGIVNAESSGSYSGPGKSHDRPDPSSGVPTGLIPFRHPHSEDSSALSNIQNIQRQQEHPIRHLEQRPDQTDIQKQELAQFNKQQQDELKKKHEADLQKRHLAELQHKSHIAHHQLQVSSSVFQGLPPASHVPPIMALPTHSKNSNGCVSGEQDQPTDLSTKKNIPSRSESNNVEAFASHNGEGGLDLRSVPRPTMPLSSMPPPHNM